MTESEKRDIIIQITILNGGFMENVISQVIGIGVIACVFFSTQAKNVKTVLILQMLCNGLSALSYLLVDGASASIVTLVAVVQTVVYYIIRAKEKTAPNILAFVFMLVFVGCSLPAYKGFLDLFVMFGAVCCSLSLAQAKPSVFRILSLLNGLSWVIYDIGIGAYTMLITHGIVIVSAVIGIIRLDLKRNNKEEQT